jgi:hypothetical protein
MSRPARFSDVVESQLASLIRKHAFLEREKRRKDDGYAERGLQNSEIAKAALDDAADILSSHVKAMVADVLSKRIPHVLGGTASDSDDKVRTGLQLGLKLPGWFAVPAEDGKGGTFGWLYQPDATPDHLDRVIDHYNEVISGHQVTRQRFVLLRDTVLARGCARDEPISTVFDDRRPPRPAEDRPIP